MHLLGFAATSLVLIAVPGPDWAFVLAAGARDHVVGPAVAGLMTGYALITALVAAGLGPLVAAVPSALTALTVAGAAYLTHLGVRTLRGTGRVEAVASPPGRHFARGVGVSALNPKGLLIFLAILPQFTEPTDDRPVAAQLAVLGGVFVLLTAAFYLPLGYAADRVLGARPRIARTTTRLAGATMVLLGAALLAERLTALA